MFLKEIIILLAFIFMCLPIDAQSISDNIQLNDILEKLQIQDDDLSSIEQIVELLENPFNINTAHKKKLASLFFLNSYQIESIIDYINNNGVILSTTQLSLLNGFNEQCALLVSNFIYYGDKNYSGKSVRQSGYMRFAFPNNCANDEYIGSNFSEQIRYKISYKNNVEAGFIQKKDVGELFYSGKNILPGDFFSGYISLQEIKLGGNIKANVFLGDFLANFGQGLVIWKGAMFNSFDINGLYKKKSIFSKFNSSNEDNYLRGVAINLFNIPNINKIVNFNMGAFVSYRGYDATIKDGRYTSILTGGEHNTQSLLDKKNSLGELNLGMRFSVDINKLSVSANFIFYKYNKENGRVVKDYNKYQQYYGMWGNYSLDFNYRVNNYNLYGELACDYGVSFASLLGVSYNKRKLEIGALFRSYSKSYISTHAGAYRLQGDCNNQTGFTLSAGYYLNNHYKFTTFIDYAYFPEKRYNINMPSINTRFNLMIDYNNIIKWNIRYSYYFLSYKNVNKNSIKGNISYKFNNGVGLNSRINLIYKAGSNNISFGQSAEVYFPFINNTLFLYLGGGYYDAQEWEQRLYLYERDLPYTLSSRLLYGEGAWAFCMVKYKFKNICDLYIKQDFLKYKSALKFALKIAF